MAVRIPQYEDRLTPSGFVTPRAQGVEVSSAVGKAMENLGDAGTRFAGVNMAIQRRAQEKADLEFKQQEEERLRKLEAKEQADAITEAGKRVADGNLAFQSWYTNAAKNPGEFFADEVRKQWTTITQRVLDGTKDEKVRLEIAQAGFEPDFGIQNSAARTYAERSLTQLGEHHISQALGTQAKAGVVKRLDSFETMVGDNERAVAADPGLFPALRESMLSAIQNDPTLDVDTKIRVARQANDRLAYSALTSAIAKGESGAVKDAIMQRLGTVSLTDNEKQNIAVTGNVIPGGKNRVADIESKASPQEMELVKYHRDTIAKGKVGRDEQGRPVTVYISTVEIQDGPNKGKFVNVPGYYNGNIHKTDDEVYAQWKTEILAGKWPVYDQVEVADARAKEIHTIMDIEGDGKTPKATNVSVSAAKPLPAKVLRWQSDVKDYAAIYNVDPRVMLWQIKVESGGNPNATNEDDKNRTGDPSIGLSQFQPKTAKSYGIDPRDPKQSIKGQAMFMRDLLKMFNGDYEKALAGYNWGQGNLQKSIDKWGDKWLSHAPKSVQNYVNSIMQDSGRANNGQISVENIDNQSVVAAADNSKAAAVPAAVSVNKYQGIVDRLSQDKIIPLLHSAQTEINKVQTEFQNAFKSRETDHMAAFGNGEQVQKPLTLGEYQQAYGPTEGSQRYQQYVKAQQLGYDINSVRTMGVDQQRELLNRNQAVPGSPGYALAMERKRILQTAIDNVNKARADDPIAYQMSVVKQSNIKPIDWNKSADVGAELSNRVGVAYTNNKQYGSPLTLLTKQEASNLAAGMNNMSAQEKMKYLGVIRNSVKDQAAYRSILQQIAPDSVVTAMAGIITTKEGTVTVSRTFGSDYVYQPTQVAQFMLEGEGIINPSKGVSSQDGKGGKFPMPKDSDFLMEFNNQVGNAFAGNPNAASSAMQGVKAYYIGKAAREGDLSDVVNTKRLQEAINAVTGGITNINGSSVIRPWGMPEDKFKDKAKLTFDTVISNKKMTASYAGVELQNYGDGTYLVRSGTEFLRGPDGLPIVLDVVNGTAGKLNEGPMILNTPGNARESTAGKPKTK